MRSGRAPVQILCRFFCRESLELPAAAFIISGPGCGGLASPTQFSLQAPAGNASQGVMMMNSKLILAAALLSVGMASAQDYPRAETFAGYTYTRFNSASNVP